eukprot:c13600_g1_i1 orf=171-494(+)
MKFGRIVMLKVHSLLVWTILKVLPELQAFTIAFTILSKLEALHALDSSMRVVTLQGRLYILVFSVGSSMQAFLMNAKVIHDEFVGNGCYLVLFSVGDINPHEASIKV